MKRTFLFQFCLSGSMLLMIHALPSAMFAQQRQMYSPFQLKEGDVAYAFGASVALHDRPDYKSAVVEYLPAGHSVMVLGETNRFTVLRNMKWQWLKITYTNANGNQREGYVWGGSLTPKKFETKDHVFLLGLDRIIDSAYVDFRIIILQNNKILHSVLIKNVNFLFDFSHIDFEWKENIQGFDSDYNYFELKIFTVEAQVRMPYFFDNKKVLKFPIVVSQSGFVYKSIEFIFPEDKGGIPGMIRVLTRFGALSEHSFDIAEEYTEEVRLTIVNHKIKEKQVYKKSWNCKPYVNCKFLMDSP